MQTSPTVIRATIDEAFINVQKGQCGAVYASVSDLKTLTEALKGNNIRYSVSSVWFSLADIDKADAEVSDRTRIAAQDTAERAQRAEDEARLRSLRTQDLNATQSAQQASLRTKYEGTAKAAAAAISSEVVAWTKDQKGNAASSFPTYASFLTQRLTDHWEVMEINGDLEDFGMSSFKGRPLETAFARVKLRLKNQALGDYNDACFIFGQMNDYEFGATREPIAARCDDEAGVRAWQVGHGFKSEWIVTN